MTDSQLYNELKLKHQGEDRATLLMQQLKTYQEKKKNKKWYAKLFAKTVTQPKGWS